MSDVTPSTLPDWERTLNALLPLFGHRNWIVVTDSAYPAQSNPGIETLVANASQVHVVRTVLNAIAASRHVRADVYADSELGFLEEIDAPGIEEYRRQLDDALSGASVTRLPHEQIIRKLDQSAQAFRILVIKSDMTIPFASVFIELDCGYRKAGVREKIREAMLASASRLEEKR
jgi:L-fucose mutarotase/ribose pyranase (RbsD/FucU family)